MDEYSVKRYALILAKQAEFEGMKLENEIRKALNESPAYDEKAFQLIAHELESLAYKHNDLL